MSNLYNFNQDSTVDEFGVDHSNFSVRDELEYNKMRLQEKEQQQSFVNRQNFRQAGQGNVPFSELKTTDIPDEQPLFNTGQGLNQNQQMISVQPTIWESAADDRQVYDNVVRQEGNFTPPNQNMIDYTKSAIQGGMNLVGNFSDMRKMNVTDKYKHAMMNCNAAQYGQGGADVATLASNLREWNDQRTGANTLDSSQGDQYANKIGRLLGGKYPNGDCDELIQKYIKKNW